MISFRFYLALNEAGHYISSKERDKDYHPVVRFYDKEYHKKRPAMHADILNDIKKKHKLRDDHLDDAHDHGTLHFGLKHKKTGKIVWDESPADREAKERRRWGL